jgi:hypothetical protein
MNWLHASHESKLSLTCAFANGLYDYLLTSTQLPKSALLKPAELPLFFENVYRLIRA